MAYTFPGTDSWARNRPHSDEELLQQTRHAFEGLDTRFRVNMTMIEDLNHVLLPDDLWYSPYHRAWTRTDNGTVLPGMTVRKAIEAYPKTPLAYGPTSLEPIMREQVLDRLDAETDDWGMPK